MHTQNPFTQISYTYIFNAYVHIYPTYIYMYKYMNIEHTRIPAGSVHPNDRRWHRQIAFAESHAHRCAGHGFGLGSHIIFKSRFSFGVRRHAALTLGFVPPFSLSLSLSLLHTLPLKRRVGCVLLSLLPIINLHKYQLRSPTRFFVLSRPAWLTF